MCFSEEVSWLTLSAAWTGCVALATTGRPHWQALAAFLFVVGGMQLCEALLWRNPECTDANAAVSNFGAVVNHSEPLVYLAACALLLSPRSPAWRNAALGLGAVYACVFGYITWKFLSRPTEQKCTRHVEGEGLVWQWNESHPAAHALFLALLVVISFTYMPAGLDWVSVVTIVGTFVLSYRQHPAKMVGSMWCFYAAFLPWMAYAWSHRW